MLEVSNITKDYELKDQKVHALKGVSMCFRRSEFVSILGPSGCGKTTLLNIIGGLDRYTDGDLLIDGISTKKFKDKDWDTYRNHRVGFVFQSYNLIPHQTVLENVELALTLSGISKKDRREKAAAVLEKVGLGDKLKSRPNQLSGGQMQRVAIARALVNDPEIILADEPTGALDSKTSVQIMELLKEVSRNRLVIMVTHNPELAEKYSSRIIRLLDGELIEDSKPYKKSQLDKDVEKHNLKLKKQQEKLSKKELKLKARADKKRSMSFFTALGLSLKNLLTKKARTFLVAFAGSIGIIGIALVLSISSGFSTYINKMQEDTLSTYPITIEAKSVDFTSVISSLISNRDSDENAKHEKDGVYPRDRLSSIIDNVGNSLSANDLKKFNKYLNDNYSEIEDYVSAVQYGYNINLEFFKTTGEAIEPNGSALMNVIVKYSLYYFQNQTKVEIVQDGTNYKVKKTIDTDYTFIHKYSPNLDFVETALEQYGEITLSNDQVAYLAFTLLGIDPSSLGGGGLVMSSLFGRTSIFSEMIDNVNLIKQQYDLVGENSRFPEASNEALLVLDQNNEIDEYVLYGLGLLNDDDMDRMMQELVKGNKLKIKVDYESVIGTEFKVLDQTDHFADWKGEGLGTYDEYTDAEKIMYRTQAAITTTNKIKIVGIVRLNSKTSNGSLSTGVAYTKDFTAQMIEHYNNSEVITSTDLPELELNNPSAIYIYVNSFEAKEHIKDFISKYNQQAEQGDEITYSDLVGVIMSTVSTIINSITYVLIAFVSVSLIVSSIMIGIITYISVIERTKEIGVLRSVGASKRDVKRVFTAESFIVGLMAGLFGILITLLLILPINLILTSVTGVSGLASLPIVGAITLILISVLLTFIAGLFPSQVAAKKDPVLALRSE